MPDRPPSSRAASEFEGDYRPSDSSIPGAHLDPANIRVEPADVAYLMQLADALNTTLDLGTLLRRTSELVQAVIPYRLFAILLLNDHTRARCVSAFSSFVEDLRNWRNAMTCKCVYLPQQLAQPAAVEPPPSLTSISMVFLATVVVA